MQAIRKQWKNSSTAEIKVYLESLIDFNGSNTCPVNQIKNFTDIARKSTCGECVICREGILQLYIVLKDITEGKGKEGDLEVINEIALNLKDGASCYYGKLSGIIAGTLLKENYDDFEKHLKRRRCDKLVCKQYISYHISGEKCIACGDCKAKCPEDAIMGDTGLIHVIKQDSCIKCGECLKVCTIKAVEKAGHMKPKTPETPIPVGTFKSAGLGGGLMSRRKRLN